VLIGTLAATIVEREVTCLRPNFHSLVDVVT
jgi:alpha/beta superfamily hydrolase